MEESKHTKGEWSACCLKDRPHFVFGESGHITICGLYQKQEMLNDLSDEELRANAKLIAAAPDLLEALNSMLNIFNRDLPEGSIGEMTCNKAINAIKKATE